MTPVPAVIVITIRLTVSQIDRPVSSGMIGVSSHWFWNS